MQSTIKRLVSSTAIGLGLVLGSGVVAPHAQASTITAAVAQDACAEPLYAPGPDGKLVRVGWVLVPC